jgi:hypothetical protein
MNFTKPLGPFAILYEPRKTPAPAPIKKNKYKTKKERAVIALEPPAERRARHAAERQAVMAAILRKNPYSEIAISTPGACDRANALRRAAI